MASSWFNKSSCNKRLPCPTVRKSPPLNSDPYKSVGHIAALCATNGDQICAEQTCETVRVIKLRTVGHEILTFDHPQNRGNRVPRLDWIRKPAAQNRIRHQFT